MGGPQAPPAYGFRSIGPADFVDGYRVIADVGAATIGYSVVGTRGERLVLARATFGGPGDDAGVELLWLHELDADGRITADVAFDEDDLVAAFVELDDRFHRAEGAGTSALGVLTTRFINARDWDALRGIMADDFVLVDHRPASLGELHGADEYFRSVMPLFDLIPDFQLFAAVIHEARPTSAFGELLGSGTNSEGSRVELRFLSVGVEVDGKLSRAEYFAPEDFDQAMARFRMLDSQHGDRLENTATELSERHNSYFEARDWAAYEAQLAEDVAFDDRRRGFGMTAFGRSAQMELSRSVAEVAVRFQLSHLAIRGELLVLDRWSPPAAVARRS